MTDSSKKMIRGCSCSKEKLSGTRHRGGISGDEERVVGSAVGGVEGGEDDDEKRVGSRQGLNGGANRRSDGGNGDPMEQPQQHSDSSSTSGVLVHRGLTTTRDLFAVPAHHHGNCGSRRGSSKPRPMSPSASLPMPLSLPVVNASLAEGGDVPLVIIAARVQQQRLVLFFLFR